MKEKMYLSIGGVKAPLVEYCRIYKVNYKNLTMRAASTGMPVSKLFCDELHEMGIPIDRSRVRVETAFDYDEYLAEIEARQKAEWDKSKTGSRRFNVEYFRPYGSSAGEWKVEKNVNVTRLNEIYTFGRNLVVTEVRKK